jgi:hypothetical protein
MLPSDLHFVIIIPGLGDDRAGSRAWIQSLTSHWKNRGLETVIHVVNWRDGESFQPKLAQVVGLIDVLAQKGKVSLVGTSAGASMAFNAFNERKNIVHKAVNICGRLRAGNHTVRSLDRMARTSVAFKESVLTFEQLELTLTKRDRKRLMTIRPFFGDELVPSDTANLAGAVNNWIYTPEHGLSISLSLKFAEPIISFLV